MCRSYILICLFLVFSTYLTPSYQRPAIRVASVAVHSNGDGLHVAHVRTFQGHHPFFGPTPPPAPPFLPHPIFLPPTFVNPCIRSVQQEESAEDSLIEEVKPKKVVRIPVTSGKENEKRERRSDPEKKRKRRDSRRRDADDEDRPRRSRRDKERRKTRKPSDDEDLDSHKVKEKRGRRKKRDSEKKKKEDSNDEEPPKNKRDKERRKTRKPSDDEDLDSDKVKEKRERTKKRDSEKKKKDDSNDEEPPKNKRDRKSKDAPKEKKSKKEKHVEPPKCKPTKDASKKELKYPKTKLPKSGVKLKVTAEEKQTYKCFDKEQFGDEYFIMMKTTATVEADSDESEEVEPKEVVSRKYYNKYGDPIEYQRGQDADINE